MDVMKMATANVRVLKELNDCTEKLEEFNQYLDDIHGYTDAIHKFTTQFESEANRLNVLEEIQQFFMRHKAEIAKESGEADVALKDALKDMREHANAGALELHNVLVEQTEGFKKIIKEEMESFEKISSDMKAIFGAQMNQFPTLENKLAEISKIPEQLERLIGKIENSNNIMAARINTEIGNAVAEMRGGVEYGTVSTPNTMNIPKWMKWTIIVSLILIAVACLSNTIFNMFFNDRNVEEQVSLSVRQEIIQTPKRLLA